MDWTMDWITDWSMDLILELTLDWKVCTVNKFANLPGYYNCMTVLPTLI